MKESINITIEIEGKVLAVGLYYPEENIAVCGSCQGEAADPELIKDHFRNNHIIYITPTVYRNFKNDISDRWYPR